MLQKNTLKSSLISAKRSSSDNRTSHKTSSQASGTKAFMLNEFVVGCDHFHVIVVESVNADADIKNRLKPLLSSLGVEIFSEVTRFPVQGRLFIIVKAESAASGSVEPDKGDALSEMQALLTERELQIAALVALGKVNKQIAKQLQISEWTVATYLRRMFAKLRVDSRAALVYRCAPVIRRFQALSKSVTER